MNNLNNKNIPDFLNNNDELCKKKLDEIDKWDNTKFSEVMQTEKKKIMKLKEYLGDNDQNFLSDITEEDFNIDIGEFKSMANDIANGKIDMKEIFNNNNKEEKVPEGGTTTNKNQEHSKTPQA